MKRYLTVLFAVLALLAPTNALAAEDKVITLLAAGDIADCEVNGDSLTADILDTYGTPLVATLGDNAYENGTAQEFDECYDPTWGVHKAKTKPSPGNHEYNQDPDANGYYDYFGNNAGANRKGWYSYNRGDWHIISLNSDQNTGAGSSQLNWLENDLAAIGDQSCILAYWHHPRYTGGNYNDFTSVDPFWEVLYDYRADVVMNGHDHNYQRFGKMGPNNGANANGIREFVVGTGGRSHYQLGADTRREAGNDDTFGVLELTLSPGEYAWEFVPVAGETYTDSGSASCNS